MWEVVEREPKSYIIFCLTSDLVLTKYSVRNTDSILYTHDLSGFLEDVFCQSKDHGLVDI